MKNTTWTQATLNPQEAMLNLVSCIGAGHHALDHDGRTDPQRKKTERLVREE